VAHQRAREHAAQAVATGTTRCAHCGDVIAVGAKWDLAHSDDRRRWIGVAHAECNRRDGGFKAARLRWQRDVRRVSRAW
jgi:hypothetical protein